MFEKSCRCGKIKKNFKMDIGPFFVADCCIQAGYDHLGNKAEEKKSEAQPEGPKDEAAPAAPSAPQELSEKEKKKLEKAAKKAAAKQQQS